MKNTKRRGKRRFWGWIVAAVAWNASIGLGTPAADSRPAASRRGAGDKAGAAAESSLGKKEEAMKGFRLGALLYENPMAKESDVAGFRLEGQASATFPESRLRLENLGDPKDGQKANIVYWCPKEFPADVAISWDFWPEREEGLCIMFFAARGRGGEDVFSPALAPRTGEYKQYHHGDINALHVSYYRRVGAEGRAFQVCNLRKSYGFYMVAQGADPIGPAQYAAPPYHIQILKCGPDVRFAINDLPIFDFHDDGQTYGPLLAGGKVGFRQMAPMIGEYANLKVHALARE